MQWIALLRGINVGGRNKLPMAELREALAEMGLSDVQTYIQSGNIMFSGAPDDREAVAQQVSEVIAGRFGLSVPVVLRTRDALIAALQAYPFPDAPKARHVMFLSGTPSAAAAEALEPDRFLPDRFALHGAEVHLFYPNGMGRSKMTTGYFERRLDVVPTTRNWRTIHKLIDMAG